MFTPNSNHYSSSKRRKKRIDGKAAQMFSNGRIVIVGYFRRENQIKIINSVVVWSGRLISQCFLYVWWTVQRSATSSTNIHILLYEYISNLLSSQSITFLVLSIMSFLRMKSTSEFPFRFYSTAVCIISIFHSTRMQYWKWILNGRLQRIQLLAWRTDTFEWAFYSFDQGGHVILPSTYYMYGLLPSCTCVCLCVCTKRQNKSPSAPSLAAFHLYTHTKWKNGEDN